MVSSNGFCIGISGLTVGSWPFSIVSLGSLGKVSRCLNVSRLRAGHVQCLRCFVQGGESAGCCVELLPGTAGQPSDLLGLVEGLTDGLIRSSFQSSFPCFSKAVSHFQTIVTFSFPNACDGVSRCAAWQFSP